MASLEPKYLVTAGLLLVALYLSRRRPANKAPFVSYWIPWVGSAISLGRDPDGFFRRAVWVLYHLNELSLTTILREKYGPVFTVRAVGRDVTYVTSPRVGTPPFFWISC